jgi:4-hydroxythreonine-4-phosphate dehydrogenase
LALDRPLVITAGEPAGIGPELCNALVDSSFVDDIVVIGDQRQLSTALDVIDTAFPELVSPGQPSPSNAETLLRGLRMAAEGCLDGRYSGMVTAPISKSGDLRVALASTHMPLRDVADYLTADLLEHVLRILHADLRDKFGISVPEIVVCGLNPHAGENGHLGGEETAFITPTIRKLRDEGLNLRGPLPADTAFTPAAGHKDAVLAMYHDQGLPVLKYAGFGSAVNVTLGLPIIRTSVDHGTAFDIAGTGRADPSSLFAAVELAASMARN